MAERPTRDSVTDVACNCAYLPSAADDPKNPITFDVASGGYQFTYQEADCIGLSMLVIFHCPFCGGVAPRHPRNAIFYAITPEEETRLSVLLEEISSIQDAIEKFGQPVEDGYLIERETRLDSLASPPRFARFRHLKYSSLSESVDVWIRERVDGSVGWVLYGKPISAS